MSKKKATRPSAAAPDVAEVIHTRTLREQRWAFDQRRRRLSWSQIADLAIKPPSEGGLGYARSPSALKAAYAVHVAEVQQIEEATRPESTMLMLATLDDMHRELTSLAGPVDHLRTAQARRMAEADGKSAEEVEAVVVLRPDADRRDAIKALAVVERDRAKLLGLDAPINVEVTHHDATVAELEDARARLGIVTPIKKKANR